jgi:hypothetical protein
MPQQQAVEMLAEYVVFQEEPQQAKISLLTEAINFAVQTGLSEDQRIMAIAAFINRAPWCGLLNRELSDELRFAATELASRETSD